VMPCALWNVWRICGFHLQRPSKWIGDVTISALLRCGHIGKFAYGRLVTVEASEAHQEAVAFRELFRRNCLLWKIQNPELMFFDRF
jgi:hypothetical protein